MVKQMVEKDSEFFFTAEPVSKQVTKEEFEEFIKSYPRPLRIDVCGIYDPPLISYNDFALANRWPYSIVAHTYVYDDDPDDHCYAPPEQREYNIVENYDELFKSKKRAI